MRAIVASDLMTPEVLTVRDDMSVSDLATFLSKNEITGAPVEDDDGMIVGVVSVIDIVRADSEDADGTVWKEVGHDTYRHDWEQRLRGDGIHVFHLNEDDVLVRDIMNPSVYSVAGDASVAEIAQTLLRYHLHRVLVIEDDRLVGIISTTDLLGLFLEED